MKIKRSIALFAALLWVLVLLGAAVRSVLQDDARFGWVVYADVVSYDTSYLWLVSEKQFETYRVPANELMLQAQEVLAPGESHVAVYGFGAVKCMVKDYLKYMTTKDTIYRPRVSL
ncbi:MAG: hypothetical protein H6765_06365 [Candidatus Peribacteria bacterium]|nr:MAG: hypothetical protein H6765_06365 [Candidatus Peribacteria bacterium]